MDRDDVDGPALGQRGVGEDMAGRGGVLHHGVHLGEAVVGDVVVDVPLQAAEGIRQVGPDAGQVGTVDRDGDLVVTPAEALLRVIADAIRIGDEVGRHPVPVDAAGVGTQRHEDAAERGLRPNAVPIGAHMPQNGDFPPP